MTVFTHLLLLLGLMIMTFSQVPKATTKLSGVIARVLGLMAEADSHCLSVIFVKN